MEFMAPVSQNSLEIPLLTLVRIFEEEAEAMCYTVEEARILATEALSDFLLTYSKNVIVG